MSRCQQIAENLEMDMSSSNQSLAENTNERRSPAYPFKNVRMVLIPHIRNIHAKNACHQ
jgi:hypothetical protein